MDKLLKIAGVVVLAWIALAVVGLVFKFLVGAVFWIALIAGGIWVFAAITGRSRRSATSARQDSWAA